MSLFQDPVTTPINASGDPYSGAKRYFYLAGTLTPATVYADASRTTALSNPVVANASGQFVPIYLDPTVTYRTILRDSADVLLRDNDNISVNTLTASSIGSALFARTTAETNASVTPTNYAVQPQNPLPKRYGASGDGTTDDTTAIVTTASANTGALIDLGGLTYRVNVALPGAQVPAGAKFINGKFTSDQTVTSQDTYSVVAIGPDALLANTWIPEQHPASGGRNFASGNHIVAIGGGALQANTTGRRNTAVGSRSLIANTSGYYNTGVGSHTLEATTDGLENTAVGTQALQACSTGDGNTAVGVGACLGVSTSNYNTGVGYGATGGGNGSGTTSGSYNTGVGYRAGYFITTGTDNVAVGRDAAVTLTTGSTNTAVGATSLTSLDTGSNNTAIGNEALRVATGSQHTAVGSQALKALTSGLGGTAVGYQAGLLATANYVTAFGYQALSALTTGDNNTAMGRNAGVTITDGAGNTMIGYGADGTASGANSTSLGNGATCTGSNQVTLGNSSVATLRCQQTSITSLSDARDKKDIESLPLGLGFVESLRPVRFTWNMRDGAKVGVPEAGFIAQELQASQIAAGAEWLGLVYDENPDRLEATPGKLIPVLVKAIQELAARVRELESR